MNPETLPKLAIRLLESLLPEENRDAVVGGLIEESALRARASTRASAAWWYWGKSLALFRWYSGPSCGRDTGSGL